MNEHFKDTQHHLDRAARTARKGVEDEVARAERRVRELAGRAEPEPTRTERVRRELETVARRVESEARRAVETARTRAEGARQAK